MKRMTTWFPALLCLGLLCSVAVDKAMAEGHPTIDTTKGWKSLLAKKDLSDWKTRGKWSLDKDGVLSRQKGGDIWTVDEYGDFVLDLEFKVTPQTNSGVGIRVSPAPDKNKKAWYADGALEIQILSPNDHKKPDMHDCGSMYDLLAATEDAQKKPGEWNRYTITAKGSKVTVVFNGKKVIDMDLNDWPEAHKNPDGTNNKYEKAMKDFPRKGHILLQFHGDPIWYRNVYVKELKPDVAKKK